MKRNFKALALALFAVLVVGAVTASGASAKFTSGSDDTTLTATAIGNQVFETVGTANEESKVECEKVSVDGATIGTETNEITVEPTYENCSISLKGLGTFIAQVDTNKCHYLFTTKTEEAIHITCETEGATQIEVTAFILGKFRKCLDIHAQTPTEPWLKYVNGTNPETGKMDVKVVSEVNGITYEKTASCAFGTIEANDARYTGEVTVTGDDANGKPVDVTKDEV
jgi:hypothetical protein